MAAFFSSVLFAVTILCFFRAMLTAESISLQDLICIEYGRPFLNLCLHPGQTLPFSITSTIIKQKLVKVFFFSGLTFAVEEIWGAQRYRQMTFWHVTISRRVASYFICLCCIPGSLYNRLASFFYRLVFFPPTTLLSSPLPCLQIQNRLPGMKSQKL